MITQKIFSFTAFLLLAVTIHAQDGVLDESFGNGGIAKLDDPDSSSRAGDIALTENQDIIAVGRIDNNSAIYNSVLKLNSDGTLDTSFGTNGYSLVNFGSSALDRYIGVFIQENGNIVAAGHHGSPNLDIVVSRFLPNGMLDTSFGNSGHSFLDIAELDYFGKIIPADNGFFIVNHSSTAGVASYLTIAKYDSEGTLDFSFGNNGVVLTDFNLDLPWPREVILDPLGNLFVCIQMDGAFPDPQQTQILKYLPDGNLDTTFAENGILIADTNEGLTRGTIQFDASGNLMVAYLSESGFPGEVPTFVSRYFDNGDLDLSFGNQGTMEIDMGGLTPHKIIVQPNGKFVLTGNIGGSEAGTFAISRLNPSGSLDTTFGNEGLIVEQFEMSDALMQNDGKLLGFGHTWWFTNELNFIWARYNNDPLSIEDNFLHKTMFYPNPSLGVFNVYSESGILQNLPYQVVDVSGKIMQEGLFTPTHTSVDLREAQSGMYFLNIENSTYKLIKE